MSDTSDEAEIAAAAAAIDAAEADEPEVDEAEAPGQGRSDDEPRSQIADTAKKIGWAGKDEWKGDPKDWIDAPEFILKAAGEVLPSMRKSLEKANEEIAGLKKAVKTSIHHVNKARQEGYEQRSRELQAELDAAAKAGNVEDVRAITQDIVDLTKKAAGEAVEGPEGNPDFEAFQEENDWYGKDKALSAAFDALCADAFEEGYTKPKAGLKEALGRLKESFPEKFAKPENANRRQPAAVEGAGAPRRVGGKSFSDMPREHQAMCLDLMKQSKAITKEGYAREYFAEEQR